MCASSLAFLKQKFGKSITAFDCPVAPIFGPKNNFALQEIRQLIQERDLAKEQENQNKVDDMNMIINYIIKEHNLEREDVFDTIANSPTEKIDPEYIQQNIFELKSNSQLDNLLKKFKEIRVIADAKDNTLVAWSADLFTHYQYAQAMCGSDVPLYTMYVMNYDMDPPEDPHLEKTKYYISYDSLDYITKDWHLEAGSPKKLRAIPIFNTVFGTTPIHFFDCNNPRNFTIATIKGKTMRAKLKTTKVAKQGDLKETIRSIFRRAGVPIKLKDAITVDKVATGYSIKIATSHTEIQYNKMMSLRAYLTHKFKATRFAVTPVNRNGTAFLHYMLLVKEIKLDIDGKPRLNKAKSKAQEKLARAMKTLQNLQRNKKTPQNTSKIRRSKIGRKTLASTNVNFNRINCYTQAKLRVLANIEGLK